MKTLSHVQHVKAFNRFAIIRAIQEHGPISRTALAQLTKLSKSSISTITAELLRQQVIGLHSVGESSGGRPATYLAFDASAGYVIGLDLANDPVTILLTDLQAQVRQEFERRPTIDDSLHVEPLDESYGAATWNRSTDCAMRY